MLRKLLLLGAALITTGACAGTAPDTSADEARLRTDAPVWFDLYNRGDAAGVANLYAEDATMMPPGAAGVTGREAIRNFLVNDIAVANREGVRINSGEITGVGVDGDLAWVTGTFTVTDGSGTVLDNGKYLSLYHRTASGWELIRDIWNTDTAPAAAAPAPPAT